MAVAKGKNSSAKAEPKVKSQDKQRTLATGGASEDPMSQGPARLYGDGDDNPEMEKPPTPPKSNVARAPRTPKPPPKAAPAGEANAKPREAVVKGNKTPAVRTTKPKA